MALPGTLSTRTGGRKRAKIDHGRWHTKKAASARDVAKREKCVLIRDGKVRRKNQSMT